MKKCESKKFSCKLHRFVFYINCVPEQMTCQPSENPYRRLTTKAFYLQTQSCPRWSESPNIMLRLREYRCLSLAFVAFLLYPTVQCRAGYAVQTGIAGDFHPIGSLSQFSDYWEIGSTSSSAHASSGGSSGLASVNLSGSDAGIHLFATSITGPSSPADYGNTQALGEWVDVLRVSGPNPPPQSLRIQVDVDGFVKAQLGSGSSAQVQVGVNTVGGPSLIGGPPTINDLGVGNSSVALVNQVSPFMSYFSSQNTNSLFYDPGSGFVSWTAYFDLSYNSVLRGYQLNLVAAAFSQGFAGGDATADFGSTIRVSGVTGANGPVTFDSGFTLSAVPEPSSLIMLMSGVVAVWSHARWRKKRATADIS